jgi:hypothetical protein
VKFSRPALLPLVLMLSACGGGGGGPSSTPTPPSSPSGPSTPGQSNTPDPPSSANASLLTLTASETFTNDAVAANVHLNAGKTSKATIKVIYDASTKSYRIDTGSRTQAFAPTDIDAAHSDGTTTVYTRTANGTTDTLTLTKPGTSGHLTFQYVGSGIWQHAPSTGAASEADLAAFTYGVETPDTALPRTGSGGYAIDLRGIVSAPIPATLDGTGTLQANFATGEMKTVGSYSQHNADGTGSVGSLTFSGTAQIASASNNFDGALRLDGFSTDGAMSGRFYGPNANEVGATFQLVDASSAAVIGTITGRQDPSIPFANLRLTDLRYDQSFDIKDTRKGFSYFPNGDIAGWFYPIEQDATLAYSASNGSYEFKNSELDLSFGPANRDAGHTNAHETAYAISSGDYTGSATLFTPGSSNDEIEMTYASFGHLVVQNNNATSTESIKSYDVYFAFGEKTALAPKGSGHYDGLIFGQADVLAQSTAVTHYDVSGTASMNVDFQSLATTGSISPVGTEKITGQKRDFGTYNVSGILGSATLSAAFPSLDGSGYMHGDLYGPNAEELAGIFRATSANDHGTTDFVVMQGAVIAKRH